MPVDKSVDINLNDAAVDLDELDRKAAKAVRALEKEQKELGKSIKVAEKAIREKQKLTERGGIFQKELEETKTLPSGLAPSDIANKELTKQDKKTEKKIARLVKKMRKEEVKNFGKKDGFLSDKLGDVGAKNIFKMGKNPKAFFMGVAKAIPFLGGVLAAKEIADFIIDEIIKIDRFFKKFIDEIDNRVDAFRTLQEQADVQAGLTQRIITTSSGSTEPRYSYNTFELFNNDQIELENKFQMTNNSGVD